MLLKPIWEAWHMLTLNDLDVFYGDAQALWNVTMELRQREIVTLLGSNGAGKTTTLKTVSGLLHPRKGQIRFWRCSVGRSRAFQDRDIWDCTCAGREKNCFPI